MQNIYIFKLYIFIALLPVLMFTYHPQGVSYYVCRRSKL